MSVTKEQYEYALAMIDSLEWDIEDAKREIAELKKRVQEYECENPEA